MFDTKDLLILTGEEYNVIMENEGDYEEFSIKLDDNIYNCILRRSDISGVWLGYVSVPNDHPLRNKTLRDIISVPQDIYDTRSLYAQFKEVADEHDDMLVGGEFKLLDSLLADIAASITGSSSRTQLMIISIFDVHGTLTFSNSLYGSGWYFGFDCGHESDIKPLADHLPTRDNAQYRTKHYAKEECIKLATQLNDVYSWKNRLL